MTHHLWDAQAETFDDQPDHGLRDPAVRAAWADLLLPLLPPAPAAVVDLGCGTGSLSFLLAEAGYDVCGVDFSAAMLGQAKQKAAGVDFRLADAADPPCDDHSCDVVLVRHLLWAMPDPDAALARWVRLLKPGGRLILVEGRWFTGAGIDAERCRSLVEARGCSAELRVLDDPSLWGKNIDDQRYLVLARPNE